MLTLLFASVIGLMGAMVAAALRTVCGRAKHRSAAREHDPVWEEIELVEVPGQEATTADRWDYSPLISGTAAWPNEEQDRAASGPEIEALRAACARLETELARQREVLATNQRGWQEERTALQRERRKLRSRLPVHADADPDDEQLFARLLQLIAPDRVARGHSWLFGLLVGCALLLVLVVACAVR